MNYNSIMHERSQQDFELPSSYTERLTDVVISIKNELYMSSRCPLPSCTDTQMATDLHTFYMCTCVRNVGLHAVLNDCYHIPVVLHAVYLMRLSCCVHKCKWRES